MQAPIHLHLPSTQARATISFLRCLHTRHLHFLQSPAAITAVLHSWISGAPSLPLAFPRASLCTGQVPGCSCLAPWPPPQTLLPWAVSCCHCVPRESLTAPPQSPNLPSANTFVLPAQQMSGQDFLGHLGPCSGQRCHPGAVSWLGREGGCASATLGLWRHKSCPALQSWGWSCSMATRTERTAQARAAGCLSAAQWPQEGCLKWWQGQSTAD